jgi:glutamine synthetase
MRSAMGEEFFDAYIKLKTRDWHSYCQQLTQWERDTTLDC